MTDANRAPAPVSPAVSVPAGDRWNVLSIVGFVISLVGFNIVAIILCAIALGQIKRTGERGRGLALWGLWIGIVSIVIGIIVVISVVSIAASNPNLTVQ
ncbi:MAG: DUF4190 domain-containing protein [Microbacteriaceae bacterium]